MTCQQSRGDWHSYVKHSLSELEMREMTSHLTHCVACREMVVGIEQMAVFLMDKGATPPPPRDIAMHVMAAIDKNKYQPKASLRPFSLKHWGISLVAAGLIMFLFNPTPLAATMAKLNNQIGWQMAKPFDQIDSVGQTAFAKVMILHTLPNKKTTKN